MQLLYQFTEQHLYDGILNAEQFGIHGGDKAFFVIRSLVSFHLVLLKHQKMKMSDFHKLSGFTLKKKVHLRFQVGEPFFFVIAKDIFCTVLVVIIGHTSM